MSSVDLLPTVLELAGLPAPDHLPGVSLAPALAGERTARVRTATMTQLGPHLTVRTPEWKMIHGPQGNELYHLAEDPLEYRNLAADARAPREQARLALELARIVGDAAERYAHRRTSRRARPVELPHLIIGQGASHGRIAP